MTTLYHIICTNITDRSVHTTIETTHDNVKWCLLENCNPMSFNIFECKMLVDKEKQTDAAAIFKTGTYTYKIIPVIKKKI